MILFDKYRTDSIRWFVNRSANTPVWLTRNILKRISHRLLGTEIQELSESSVRQQLLLQAVDIQLMKLHPPNIYHSIESPPPILEHHFTRAVLYNIPLERIRSKIFYKADSLTHPFIYAVNRIKNIDEPTMALRLLQESLEKHYMLAPPTNIGNIFTFLSDRSPIIHLSYHAFLAPWVKGSIAKNAKNYVEFFKSEAFGGEVLSDLEFNDALPIEALVRSHCLRLYLLYRSLRQHGYTPQRRPYLSGHGNIGGYILMNDSGQWCCMISGGQHRIAVAAALGIDPIPINLFGIIRRKEANNWAQVRNGAFTVEEAQEIFDVIMSGSLPATYTRWADFVFKKNHD